MYGQNRESSLYFVLAHLSGCSVGKDCDTPIPITRLTVQSRLTIALSGNTKYRADETVTLTYTLGGELA